MPSELRLYGNFEQYSYLLFHKYFLKLSISFSFICSALDDVIKTSSDDVLYLSIMFFERVENLDSLNSISIPPENKFDNIRGFLGESLRHWSAMILTFSSEERKNQLPGVKISDLATLLGILKSYPHFFCSNENLLEIKNFRESIIHLLLVDAGKICTIIHN